MSLLILKIWISVEYLQSCSDYCRAQLISSGLEINFKKYFVKYYEPMSQRLIIIMGEQFEVAHQILAIG